LLQQLRILSLLLWLLLLLRGYNLRVVWLLQLRLCLEVSRLQLQLLFLLPWLLWLLLLPWLLWLLLLPWLLWLLLLLRVLQRSRNYLQLLRLFVVLWLLLLWHPRPRCAAPPAHPVDSTGADQEPQTGGQEAETGR
jgi:hypothetical protein